MPMAPTCHEKYGKGSLVRKKGGRNPVYELTGFPAASIIACTLPNGGTLRDDAARFFDLPGDGGLERHGRADGPGRHPRRAGGLHRQGGRTVQSTCTCPLRNGQGPVPGSMAGPKTCTKPLPQRRAPMILGIGTDLANIDRIAAHAGPLRRPVPQPRLYRHRTAQGRTPPRMRPAPMPNAGPRKRRVPRRWAPGCAWASRGRTWP